MNGMRAFVVCVACAVAGVSAVAPVRAGHSAVGCSACHTPHNAESGEGPLWSPKYHNVETSYSLYATRTLDADVQQPNGATRLCLGCHDGSYGPLAGDGDSGAGRVLGTDLRNDHPVSFHYGSAAAADPHIRPASSPAGTGSKTIADILDAEGRAQCTTCHDVHQSTPVPALLRWNLAPGGDDSEAVRDRAMTDMCRVCHDK